MSANVIIFEGQYMADNMRNIDHAKKLTEEAIEILKKASAHRHWKCRETANIDNMLGTISNRLGRLDMGIVRTGIALGRGLVSVTELEQRSQTQANTLSDSLKNNYGFTAQDKNTGADTTLPVMMIPAMIAGKITVSVLQNWFAKVHESIRKFWESFAAKNNPGSSGQTPSPSPTPIPEDSSEPVNIPQSNNVSMTEAYPANFDKALSMTLEYEGGYVWDPYDPGGETNMGITRATMDRAYQQGIVSHDSVKDLTQEEVAKIYYEMYWKPSNADKMPDPLATLYFDTVVLCGGPSGGKRLQNAMNNLGLGEAVIVDGYVGPQTIEELQRQLKTPEDISRMCDALMDDRQAYHNQDTNAWRYLTSWTSRVDKLRNYADNWDYA